MLQRKTKLSKCSAGRLPVFVAGEYCSYPVTTETIPSAYTREVARIDSTYRNDGYLSAPMLLFDASFGEEGIQVGDLGSIATLVARGEDCSLSRAGKTNKKR